MQKITKDNFIIDSGYLKFRPSNAKTWADYVHICSRDKRFHKWTCAKVRNLLIKVMNEENVTEDEVDRQLIEIYLYHPLVRNYILDNVPYWMKERNTENEYDRH